MASGFPKQIANRNFLAPVGFKFTLAKEPKVDFFSNSCRIPEISLGTAVQPTYLKILMFLEISYLMVISHLNFL